MNLILPSFCILLLILIQVVFYSKERIKTFETKIYQILLIISSFNIVFNIIGIYTGYNSGNIKLLYFLNHLDLPLYFWWASLLFVYLIQIDNYKFKDKIKKLVFVLNFVFTIITLFLPFNIVVSKSEGFATGLCVNFVYLVSFIYILGSLIQAIKIAKDGQLKKTIPMFSLLILGIVAAIVQNFDPNLIIVPSIIVFIELIMFFTIENPDIKILNEYIKNKSIAESNIEDKSNLLFRISQDVKLPLKKIEILSNSIINNHNLKENEKYARSINVIAKNVTSMINNVLDISYEDIHNIKIYDTIYNPYNLFNQIVKLAGELKKENVELKYSISSLIPESLFGDAVRLKQIIHSILNHSYTNTSNGYIDLDINAIVKYDVCRLIITISDTGKPLSIEYINSVIEENEILEEKGFEIFDELNLDLKNCKKLINMIGGSLLIKSDEKFGNSYTIIINQKIEDEKIKVKDKLNNMSFVISNKDKVIVLNDNYIELEKISKELRKKNYEVFSTMNYNDCLNKLQKESNIKYVLIDDEMDDKNAIEIIDKIDTTKTKIIIMLNKDKEQIKNHYLKDYPLYDYLLKDNYIEEIKRIKNKN